MPKTNETVLEIDLKALEHNFNYFKSKIKSTTKFLGVVKAFAYGSDAIKIAKKLEQLQVDYLAVAYTGEGVSLRKSGVQTPILVLHPQPINFDQLIEYNLEPSIYSHKILDCFLNTVSAKELSKYPVHLKFNTGLNRLGFIENEVDTLIKKLNAQEVLKITSIFSHLAASEDAKEQKFTVSQIEAFTRISAKINAQLTHTPFKHILNTSGILNYPSAQFDMVRSGIGLYGFGNNKETDTQLKPVASLKTIISQIHKIEPNGSVGYNRGFTSNKPTVTATLPIGHADGIGRQYGNGKTYVLVNGKKAPIIGNVCMDMIMIDVTDISCKEGDEVVIFGQDNSAEEFAATANTISYELVTGISQRVKRVLIE